jgi:hypothetical protein
VVCDDEDSAQAVALFVAFGSASFASDFVHGESPGTSALSSISSSVDASHSFVAEKDRTDAPRGQESDAFEAGGASIASGFVSLVPSVPSDSPFASVSSSFASISSSFASFGCCADAFAPSSPSSPRPSLSQSSASFVASSQHPSSSFSHVPSQVPLDAFVDAFAWSSDREWLWVSQGADLQALGIPSCG